MEVFSKDLQGIILLILLIVFMSTFVIMFVHGACRKKNPQIPKKN